jgi:hypothetical protein
MVINAAELTLGQAKHFLKFMAVLDEQVWMRWAIFLWAFIAAV